MIRILLTHQCTWSFFLFLFNSLNNNSHIYLYMYMNLIFTYIYTFYRSQCWTKRSIKEFVLNVERLGWSSRPGFVLRSPLNYEKKLYAIRPGAKINVSSVFASSLSSSNRYIYINIYVCIYVYRYIRCALDSS